MEQQPTTLEDLRELLEENIEATEENTKILKAMRRDAVIGGVLKFVFWIAIIAASAYFSMKFLEPYLGMAESAGQQAEEWGALLELYKGQGQ